MVVVMVMVLVMVVMMVIVMVVVMVMVWCWYRGYGRIRYSVAWRGGVGCIASCVMVYGLVYVL